LKSKSRYSTLFAKEGKMGGRARKEDRMLEKE